MKLFIPSIFFLVILTNSSAQSFDDIWKKISDFSFSRIVVTCNHSGGDYLTTTPNIGFRQTKASIEIFSRDYSAIPAPVLVHQETYFIHPLERDAVKATLTQLGAILKKGSYFKKEPGCVACGATLDVIWKSSSTEDHYTIELEYETLGELITLERELIKNYFLHPKRN